MGLQICKEVDTLYGQVDKVPALCKRVQAVGRCMPFAGGFNAAAAAMDAASAYNATGIECMDVYVKCTRNMFHLAVLCGQLEVRRGLWHLLLWHTMKCNS